MRSIDKEYICSILDTVKRNLEKNNSQRHFSQLSQDFYELFSSHYVLINSLDLQKKALKETHLITALENIRCSLEGNLKLIIEILEQLTDRTFIIYVTADSDTLWKTARRFNCSIEEICELNSIKNVFKLEENKVLLIPVTKQL
ncbi:MAG: LysM peptidoglycan-binding domain-containing protein [Clostridia bacterium]|nr:LysM peptidoglycan-binding domain-containing protein [Clostridia bacterium]